MSREKAVRRISVGLTKKEWDMVQAATRVRYSIEAGDPGPGRRSSLIKTAVWAFCRALVRKTKIVEKSHEAPRPSKGRRENKEEFKQRTVTGRRQRQHVGESVDLAWLKQQFPEWWN